MAGLRGRIDPGETMAPYSDWMPAAESYRLMFGYAVAEANQPDGVEVVHVPPRGTRSSRRAGANRRFSIEAWKRIALWPTEPGLVTTGSVSIEVHDGRIRRMSRNLVRLLDTLGHLTVVFLALDLGVATFGLGVA